MTHPLRRLLVAGLVLLAGASAHAGTLTNATWFQTEEVRYQGAVLGTIPLSRTWAELGGSGTSTATSIAVSLSYPFLSTNFFLPKTPNCVCPSLAVHATQGGPQAITATAGMGAGTPGIAGTVVLMTAMHVATGVDASMFAVGFATLVSVPLSIGKADQFLNTFTVVGAVHFMTVDFFTWTPGTLVFTGLTTFFTPLPNVSAAGSFNLTPNGGGTVTLVSPSKISIDGPVDQRRTVSFATLKLTFVPEPAPLLLIVAGVVGLALGERRRSR